MSQTWIFNDTINASDDIVIECNFVNNNENHREIGCILGVHPITGETMIVLQYSGSGVYNSTTSWTNEAYKTIILEEAASGDLLTFLEANATLQSEVYGTVSQSSISDIATSIKTRTGNNTSMLISEMPSKINTLTYTEDATALAAQIVSGETAYVCGNKVTGTMANFSNTSF